jgi:hypothetical protein
MFYFPIPSIEGIQLTLKPKKNIKYLEKEIMPLSIIIVVPSRINKTGLPVQYVDMRKHLLTWKKSRSREYSKR